jgi:hypothetical protein
MKGEGAGGWCRGGCADPPARGGKRSRSQGRQKSRLPHNEHAWLWYDGDTAMYVGLAFSSLDAAWRVRIRYASLLLKRNPFVFIFKKYFLKLISRPII